MLRQVRAQQRSRPAAASHYTPAVKEAPASPAARGSARVRRPTAVTVLAVLQLLKALVYGLLLAALLAAGSSVLDVLASDRVLDPGLTLELEVEAAALVALVAGLFLASLLAGVLLLRMRQLGWTITMLLAGLSLGLSLAAWLLQGASLEFWLLVEIVTVFYLNQRRVREAFGISRPAGGFALQREQE